MWLHPGVMVHLAYLLLVQHGSSELSVCGLGRQIEISPIRFVASAANPPKALFAKRLTFAEHPVEYDSGGSFPR